MINLSMCQSILTTKTPIVLHNFMEITIKMIMIMVQAQNCKIWLHFWLGSRIYFFLAKKMLARFQLKNWSAQLGFTQFGKSQLKLITIT